jgi:hypothetical protein
MKELEAAVEPCDASWELYCFQRGITPDGHFVISSALYSVQCSV